MTMRTIKAGLNGYPYDLAYDSENVCERCYGLFGGPIAALVIGQWADLCVCAVCEAEARRLGLSVEEL